MALFDRLDKKTSRTADRLFSVAAIVDTLQRTPNGRPVPDPDRGGEILLKGIFDEVPAFSQIEAGNRDRRGNDMRALVTGTAYEFSVDLRRYPAAKDIQQGDQLTLDDARSFDIVAVRPDGLSRTVLVLVKG